MVEESNQKMDPQVSEKGFLFYFKKILIFTFFVFMVWYFLISPSMQGAELKVKLLVVAYYLGFGFIWVALVRYIVQRLGRGSVLWITMVSLIIPTVILFFMMVPPVIYLGLFISCYIAIEVFKKDARFVLFVVAIVSAFIFLSEFVL